MTGKPNPLIGPERDEIVELVSRIKRADEKLQRPMTERKAVAEHDAKWAEDNQLPREFFEFFTLERVA